MAMTDREPTNVSDSASNDDAANNRIPPDFARVFTRKNKTNPFQNKNTGSNWCRFRLGRNSQDSPIGLRPKHRVKKLRKRKNVLPAVKKDDQGAVYLPRSDVNSRQPQDSGGREVLPQVTRNSVGDIYLSTDGWQQQQHPELEPTNSERTPSSVVMAQIDAIYDYPPTRQPVPQYFGNSRLPPTPSNVVTDEGDDSSNEDNSTLLYAMLYNERASRFKSRPTDKLHRKFTPHKL